MDQNEKDVSVTSDVTEQENGVSTDGAVQDGQSVETEVTEKPTDEGGEEDIALQKDVPEAERIEHSEQGSTSDEDPDARVDIFAWANNLYQFKNQLKVELFLVNKNNVVYKTKLDQELQKQMQPLFIDEILNEVLAGAASGMQVRDFEDGEAETKVLQRTHWENVEKLKEVMHWIHTQEAEIELFVEEEHDLKRIKAALARCTHPSMKEPFYVIKALPTAQMLKGEGAWMVNGKQFVPFESAAALRIPADNQLLLVNNDLFVFSQPKLDRLFGYNAKKNSVAAKKAAEIEEKFKLSFAEGMDLQSLVKGNKPTINKLQNLEVGDIKQDSIVDHAEEIGLPLMVAEDGSIIIETSKDLTTFVNLLNDDYIESNLTGVRYEVLRKKALKPPKDEAASDIAL